MYSKEEKYRLNKEQTIQNKNLTYFEQMKKVVHPQSTRNLLAQPLLERA